MNKIITGLFVLCLIGYNVSQNVDYGTLFFNEDQIIEIDTKENQVEVDQINFEENRNEKVYEFKEEIIEEVLPYSTIVEYDETVYEGIDTIKVNGVKGVIKHHYDVKYEKEREINRSRFYAEVVDEVVDEVIVKGSKKVEPIVKKQTTAPKSNNNQTTPPKANNDTNNAVQAPEQPKVCTLNTSGSNAAQLVNEINYSRCLEGIAPLYYSNALQGYAQTRASEITTSFSHTRPNGQSCFSLNPSIINGENLYSGYDSATRAHTAFQNSPSHRKNNMNSRFKSVSVSIEYKDGIAYWAVLFSVY